MTELDVTFTEDNDHFVHENKLLKVIPGFDESEIFADAYLNEIKSILIFCVENNQFSDKYNYAIKLISRYITTFSIRVYKNDLISIIQIFYQLLHQKDIDVSVAMYTLNILKKLLKKVKKLPKNDLLLEWIPLYDIWYHYCLSSVSKNGMIYSPKPINEPLSDVIQLFSKYFSESSTREIWEKFRPYVFCPYPYSIQKIDGLKMLKLFLPFYYNNKNEFFQHIWPNLITMMNANTWINCENNLMHLMGKAAATYVGLIDWSEHYDMLFTALLRSLRIKVAGMNRKSKYIHTKLYVEILCYSIYGDCFGEGQVINRFRRFFKAINHLFHPSSHSQSTMRIYSLLHFISNTLLKRYESEHIKGLPDSSFGFYPKENYLRRDHIREMVEIMIPSCQYAMFTKNKNEFPLIVFSIQKLAFLDAEYIVPRFLNIFHENCGSDDAILQPHREMSTLTIISYLHIALLNRPQIPLEHNQQENHNNKLRSSLNSLSNYPEGKLAVFPLMRQLISYININDPPKSYVALTAFGNLANMLWIEDLSQYAHDSDLTDFEKKVAQATSQFEDLILQFFDKIFEIIEIGFTETGMVETQRNSDFSFATLTDVLVMTLPNIGSDLSKQVLDKALNFVFSHSFSSKSIQTYIATMLSCLCEKETLIDYGIEKFQPKYMKYFREQVADDFLVIGDKLDIKFVWLTNLSPSFIKNKKLSYFQKDVMEVLTALSTIFTKEAISLFNNLLGYLISTCVSPCTSIEYMYRLKDRQFHRASWRPLIMKYQIFSASGPDNCDAFKLEYKYPDKMEHEFFSALISGFIQPAIDKLNAYTDSMNHSTINAPIKLNNQELKYICLMLQTACNYICDVMFYLDEPLYKFNYDKYGPISCYEHKHIQHFLKSTNSRSLFHNAVYINLIKAIRSAATKALCSLMKLLTGIETATKNESDQTSDNTNTNASTKQPIILSELKEIFHLISSAYNLNKTTPQVQSKSFLERRFESFVDPLMKRSNSPLNWMLLLDSFQLPNPLIYQESGANKPMIAELVQVVDCLFGFLVGLTNPTLQQYAIECLAGLTQNYLLLDEYLIQKSYDIVVDTNSPEFKQLNENIHSGISQLMLRIIRTRNSLESLSFVYKLIPIFVNLSKNQHIEQRTNNNWNNRLFNTLVGYMTTFYLKLPTQQIVDSNLATQLKNSTQDLWKYSALSNDKLIEMRQKLYYSCVDKCLSMYLVKKSNTVKVHLNATDNLEDLFQHQLTPIATWRNILEMSVVLPLHPEVPIPLSFVELFFLILFSPSRDLSSQASNQISIVVWLLKPRPNRQYLNCNKLNTVDKSSSQLVYGPRASNSFQMIDRNCDFWSDTDSSPFKHFNDGYINYPMNIKLQKFNYPTKSKFSKQFQSNSDVWDLLSQVFQSTQFHKKLANFLLDLGSQFLREEETANATSPQENFLMSLSQHFSLDHLIDSIMTCISPHKATELLIATYEQLISCTNSRQIYANKISVKLITGMLFGVKRWPLQEHKKFFQQDLLRVFQLNLDHCSMGENLNLPTAILEACQQYNSIDVRHLLPLYLHVVDNLAVRYEHECSKELVCIHFILGFVKLTSWKVGPLLVDDLLKFWWRFYSSHTERLRKYAGKIMRYLCILPDLTNQFCLFPELDRSRILSYPSELKQIFAKYTHVILLDKGLEPSVCTLKALKITEIKSSDPYPSGVLYANHAIDDHETDPAVDLPTISSPPTPTTDSEMETPPNETFSDNLDEFGECSVLSPNEEEDDFNDNNIAASHKIIGTMLGSLMELFSKLEEFIPIELLDLFVIVLDLIPIRDKIVIYTHLRQCALVVSNLKLSHDEDNVVAGTTVRKVPTSAILKILDNASHHRSWRIRIVATKMIQITSFNNLFVIASSPTDTQAVMSCVFRLMKDSQLEVRSESGNLLSGLLQCGLFQYDDSFLRVLMSSVQLLAMNGTKYLKPNSSLALNMNIDGQPSLVEQHASVVSLCAFIQAHPFDIPEELPEVITVLCSCINKPEPICTTVRDTLAKFKKSHQDSWHLERRHFTEDQLCALTDVLVSPSYYA